MIQYHTWKHGGWIRLFGWGIWCTYEVDRKPLFSERVGYIKVYRVGNLYFKFLGRD